MGNDKQKKILINQIQLRWIHLVPKPRLGIPIREAPASRIGTID